MGNVMDGDCVCENVCTTAEDAAAASALAKDESTLRAYIVEPRHVKVLGFKWLDPEASHCPICEAPFTWTHRKHYCRRCGQVVCIDCASNFVVLYSGHGHGMQPGHGTCRVCDICFPLLQRDVLREVPADVWMRVLSYLEIPHMGSFVRSCRTSLSRGIPLPYKVLRRWEEYFGEERKYINAGAYGEVFESTVKNRNNMTVAVKVMRKIAFPTVKHWRMVIREIEVQSRVDNPQSIQLYDVLQDDTSLYLVMEMAKGGDAFDWVVKQGYVPERLAASIARHLLLFADNIYTNHRAVHRDLKLENLLLMDVSPVVTHTTGTSPSEISPTLLIPPSSSSTASPAVSQPEGVTPAKGPATFFPVSRSTASAQAELKIKVADFGLAKFLVPPTSRGRLPWTPTIEWLVRDSSTRSGIVATPCGTLGYTAPEVLCPTMHCRPKLESMDCVHKLDVYSIGVILHILLTGSEPYPSQNLKEHIRKAKRGIKITDSIYEQVSPSGRTVLHWLVGPSSTRPTAKEALQSEYFNILTPLLSPNPSEHPEFRRQAANLVRMREIVFDVTKDGVVVLRRVMPMGRRQSCDSAPHMKRTAASADDMGLLTTLQVPVRESPISLSPKPAEDRLRPSATPQGFVRVASPLPETTQAARARRHMSVNMGVISSAQRRQHFLSNVYNPLVSSSDRNTSQFPMLASSPCQGNLVMSASSNPPPEQTHRPPTPTPVAGQSSDSGV